MPKIGIMFRETQIKRKRNQKNSKCLLAKKGEKSKGQSSVSTYHRAVGLHTPQAGAVFMK